MNDRRVLDWRFWIALAACLMVAYLVVGGYQDNVAKGHRIDRLIAAAEDQDRVAAEAAANASAERRALLANQDRLLRQAQRQARRLDDLERRQAALLAFLTAQGITVPPEFTGNLAGRPGSRTHHKAELTGKSPVKGGGHGHPKGGGTTTTPTPDLGAVLDDLLDQLLHP